MNRKRKRLDVPSYHPEGLEPRGLLTTGLASGLNTVMELGVVTQAAALKGVEVAAPIPAHGSITFEFQAGAAGHYLLEVRHVGEGLTLQATGPSGSASVDPGPAGPFETVALPLKAAGYQIKASATGDQSVYVDWELLLTTGVGQSAAIAPTLAATSAAVPLTGLSTTAAPSASSPSMTSPSIAPGGWGAAVSPSLVATGGPVGRSDPLRAITPVGPVVSHGGAALASAGDDLPVGALKAPAPVADEPPSVLNGPMPVLAFEAMGDHGADLEALETSSWFDGLARLRDWAGAAPGASPTGPVPAEAESLASLAAAEAGGDSPGEESKGSVMTAASPALVLSGVVLASAARRWRRGRWLPTCRPKTTAPMPFPPSNPGWGI